MRRREGGRRGEKVRAREKKGMARKANRREGEERRRGRRKDGPGPVMFSNTVCPAVHILGT